MKSEVCKSAKSDGEAIEDYFIRIRNVYRNKVSFFDSCLIISADLKMPFFSVRRISRRLDVL